MREQEPGEEQLDGHRSLPFLHGTCEDAFSPIVAGLAGSSAVPNVGESAPDVPAGNHEATDSG